MSVKATVENDNNVLEFEKKVVCSRQKLSRDFKKLSSVGLVVETEINNKKAYLLPYDEAEKMFSLIPTLTIKYLLKVKSSYCVKAFIYLLNCYLYKEKINEKYLFSKGELCEAVGLAIKTENREEIDYILNSLHNEGLLSYRSVVAHINGKAIPYYELLEVRFYVKGLNYKKEEKKKTIRVEGRNHIKEEKILPPIEEEKPKETTVNEQIKMTKEEEDYYQNWIEHLDEGRNHIKEEKILPPIEEEKPKETTVNEQIKMTKEEEDYYQNWIEHLDKQIKEGKDNMFAF